MRGVSKIGKQPRSKQGIRAKVTAKKQGSIGVGGTGDDWEDILSETCGSPAKTLVRWVRLTIGGSGSRLDSR
ncbi:hypothetical protein RRF57_009183 [Xylaria bambusicola]|uniref:Uncharacterized protein n=1 Tax=Xylaria bambusicola TaxID=326684 RepID=A0AAN7V2D7_9PEZI